MSLYKSFLNYILKNNLITDKDSILIGVSGGVDSVVLLNLLKKLQKKMDLNIGVAHVNYSLRGIDSDCDETLVNKLAKTFNFPVYTKKIDLNKYLKSRKESLQEAARNIRYEFYSEIAEKYGYNKIAVAHNANDNAETVLLNLFRGTGISGLRGIPVKRYKIIRPLLFACRDEISKFAKENNISFRHDKTNFENKYNRNFLRLDVFPLIQKKINPNVYQNILRFSEIFSDFEKFLNGHINLIIKEIIIEKNVNEICLDIQKLNNYIKFIQEKIVLKIVDILTGKSINAEKVLKILGLVSSQTGRKIQVNKDLYVWKNRTSLNFCLNFEAEQDQSPVELIDEVHIGNSRISIAPIEKSKVIFSDSPKIEYIDKDEIIGKLFLRRWENSDFFYPLGLQGKKKISDFLTEKKIPVNKKKNVLILVNNGNIVWVCGFRLDNRFKIRSRTENVLKLEINNNQDNI